MVTDWTVTIGFNIARYRFEVLASRQERPVFGTPPQMHDYDTGHGGALRRDTLANTYAENIVQNPDQTNKLQARIRKLSTEKFNSPLEKGM